MSITQENRVIAVDTPLGRDVLLLLGFKGHEEISTPFQFELEMVSENHNISFESIVGKNATISVVLADGGERFFNGVVAGFSQGRGGEQAGSDPRYSFYSATLVPWVWLLKRYADVRVFQEMTTPDIVEKIFNDRGFSDFKLQLQGNYEKRTYCVQYRETDFNFVSRLLEEEGIYYYFEHDRVKHTLVLADSASGHKPCPRQDSARYQITTGGQLEEDVITSLDVSKQVRVGKCVLNDYNYEMPNTDLKTNVSSRQMLGPGKREVYDYPGLYPNKGRGDRLTTVRMEEEEAQITSIRGTSDCRAFTTGYRFTLQDFYRQDMNNKAYVLTRLSHEGYEGASYPGLQTAAPDYVYANSFECIPYDVLYRPLRRAEKPRVFGTQTAVVVGPSGEEIHTDDLGRIKVQFHWDREGKKDENSSCWIRVGQLWAGPQWGAVYIPRIGQEVIVDFLEGDPDRPLVVGCVYHKSNMPPLNLPGEKTRSTIKSDSTIGGGGFNEIRFEDKKGKEEIYIHAQKDKTVDVGNDRTVTIYHDDTLTVEQGNRTTTVKQKDDLHTVSLGNMLVKVPAGTYALKAMNIIIKADAAIKIKCGASSILMTPAMIKIKSPMVKIN
jgi:type VI secretion system secreted protein VgrG